MATLTAWKFPTAAGAENATATLEELARQQLIVVHDAATVSWEPGKRKPTTRQLHSVVGAGALGGTFWGLLFGLIFFVPLLGAAIGAAVGALSGALTDVGIDDTFIKRAREEITPGTSALFALTSNAVQDRVREAFASQDVELLFSNLSREQEDTLRRTYGE